jgi:hypothetical protein
MSRNWHVRDLPADLRAAPQKNRISSHFKDLPMNTP